MRESIGFLLSQLHRDSPVVIPAKAGIYAMNTMDSRMRGNDGKMRGNDGKMRGNDGKMRGNDGKMRGDARWE